MEFYHNNMSVCAQKVRLVIAEKNLAPTEHHKMLRNGDTHTAEYLRLNPKGVVPTLIDKGQVIVESTIICEYLDEAYPQNRLMPEDPTARAKVRWWTQLPDAGLHQACGFVSTAIAWRKQILAAGGVQLQGRPRKAGGGHAISDLLQRGVESEHCVRGLLAYDDCLSDMATALQQHAWLGGDQYTLADVAMLPYIQRLAHLSLDWMWDDERSAIQGWFERCCARENYRAISDYLEPTYVALCNSEGRIATPRIREILAQ